MKIIMTNSYKKLKEAEVMTLPINQETGKIDYAEGKEVVIDIDEIDREIWRQFHETEKKKNNWGTRSQEYVNLRGKSPAGANYLTRGKRRNLKDNDDFVIEAPVLPPKA
jgi:hypothetical protein